MAAVGFTRFRLDDLLGPLNEVERKNAPQWLYLAGDAGLLRLVPRVSIVGNRDASVAGLRRASKLARELVAHGAVVVSGLARRRRIVQRSMLAEGRSPSSARRWTRPIRRRMRPSNVRSWISTSHCPSSRRGTRQIERIFLAGTEPWRC